jgi:hypothetical protein
MSVASMASGVVAVGSATSSGAVVVATANAGHETRGS